MEQNIDEYIAERLEEQIEWYSEKSSKALSVSSRFEPQDTFDLEEYLKERESEVNRLKSIYDMDTLSGIESIPITIEAAQYMDTSDSLLFVAYLLHRKATEHKKNGQMNLAIACLLKSNRINTSLSSTQSRKEYERVVKWLVQDGYTDAALKEQQYIDFLFEEGQLTLPGEKIEFAKPAFNGLFNPDNMSVVPSEPACNYLLGKDNQTKAIADLLSLNDFLFPVKMSSNLFRFRPSKENGRDYIRFAFSPLSKTGKMRKFPLKLFFSTHDTSAQVEGFHGQIYYLNDHSIGKFNIVHSVWREKPKHLQRSSFDTVGVAITSYEYNFTTRTGEKRKH